MDPQVPPVRDHVRRQGLLYKGIDDALHAQQRQIVGKVIVALKAALVANGMADKLITYTPRYNAFIEGGAYNTNQFRTDGEGIDVVEYSA